MIEQVVRIEQVADDFGRAGLAPLLEQFGRHELRLGDIAVAELGREEAATGLGQRGVQRLLVGLIDIDHRRIGDQRPVRPARRLPVGEELHIARRRVGAWKQEEIAGVHALPGVELQGGRIAGLHPQRRMGLLRRVHRQQQVVVAVELAFEVERLVVGKRRLEEADELDRLRATGLVIDLEGPKQAGTIPGTSPTSLRPSRIWSAKAISSTSLTGSCSGTIWPIAPSRIRRVRAPAATA